MQMVDKMDMTFRAEHDDVVVLLVEHGAVGGATTQ